MRANTKLEKQADALHSYLVRQKAAIEFEGKPEHARCFTCGNIYHWKKLECGHCLTKKAYPSLRYDFMNTEPQCFFCNIKNEGRHIIFLENLIKKHGKEAIDKMRLRGNNLIKERKFYLEYIIEERLRELLQLKIKYPSVEIPKGFVRMIKELNYVER